jgi:hemoglobin-like flavoprotein
MTPEQKALVKSTWNMVVPIADTAAQLFYGKLFEVDPSTRPMFKSTDMPEQRKKLMQALATVIGGLDNLAPLIPVLQTLGTTIRSARHCCGRSSRDCRMRGRRR